MEGEIIFILQLLHIIYKKEKKIKKLLKYCILSEKTGHFDYSNLDFSGEFWESGLITRKNTLGSFYLFEVWFGQDLEYFTLKIHI